MATTIHGGSIGRWFEELCRIRHPRLRAVAVDNETSLRPNALPRTGGVYVFWWTGDVALLRHAACNRDLTLVGPGGRAVHLTVDDEWLGISTGLPIPLYVGKSADSIAKRVGLHLRLSQGRMLPLGGGAKRAPRPTTSCQLRAGVEHLFPNEADSRSLAPDNLGLSFVVLSADQHAANRFYLEDLAIGLMRPPFNVDVER
jgi:hypothetical protein